MKCLGLQCDDGPTSGGLATTDLVIARLVRPARRFAQAFTAAALAAGVVVALDAGSVVVNREPSGL